MLSHTLESLFVSDIQTAFFPLGLNELFSNEINEARPKDMGEKKGGNDPSSLLFFPFSSSTMERKSKVGRI